MNYIRSIFLYILMIFVSRWSSCADDLMCRPLRCPSRIVVRVLYSQSIFLVCICCVAYIFRMHSRQFPLVLLSGAVQVVVNHVLFQIGECVCTRLFPLALPVTIGRGEYTIPIVGLGQGAPVQRCRSFYCLLIVVVSNGGRAQQPLQSRADRVHF